MTHAVQTFPRGAPLLCRGRMAVQLKDPEYPIIEKEPSFSKIGGARLRATGRATGDSARAELCPFRTAVSSFRREDITSLAGATLLGAPLGYYLGASCARWPSAARAAQRGALELRRSRRAEPCMVVD